MTLVLALFLLNASLTFHNVWPTPSIAWRGALSAELAFVVLGMVVVMHRRAQLSRPAITALSAIWLLLVIGRYATVTAPALWGRELNFYWDLHFLPDVVAMLVAAARPWLAMAAGVGLITLLAAFFFTIRWALGRVAVATRDGRSRRALVAGSVVVLLLFALQSIGVWSERLPRFPAPVTTTYARQVGFIIRATTGRQALAPSPSFASDLSRVKGADILLLFIESYGAVTFEKPEFDGPLRPSRQALAAAIADTGNSVVSAYVTSPTFGGSSWFAHITLMSGLEIGDPDKNALLMTEARPTLPRALAERGYRSVGMMPGLWYPWPEGAFYGFNEIYNGERLAYRGPSFGWWSMTDQFVLAALDAHERSGVDRKPLFVFFPTISTHTPFAPTPPYQPDWRRMLTDHPYDSDVLASAYDQSVDWMDMGPGYRSAVAYTYETLAGYLREHRNDDAIVILIGDHQPPALVSGEGAPWDVPVHIIAKRAAILERLEASGFRAGITPARPTLGPMHTLTPLLLAAFGE